MKPLTLIAIALWLSYCATPEETATFQTMEAAMRAGCNIENMVWEPIGEQPRREGFSAIYDYGGGWSMYRDPHKTQCLGRDPEPLECVWGKSVLDPSFAQEHLFCRVDENADRLGSRSGFIKPGWQEYRTLTGMAVAGTAPAEDTPVVTDLAQRLRELDELKEEELISEDEYQRLREQALGIQ